MKRVGYGLSFHHMRICNLPALARFVLPSPSPPSVFRFQTCAHTMLDAHTTKREGYGCSFHCVRIQDDPVSPISNYSFFCPPHTYSCLFF
jgi:hypothetical protein